jgi:NAD(P) transhydrogenase subunit beta
MENLINIQIIQNIVYIISSVMFILGIKMLGNEATAVKGNYLSALAMFFAVASLPSILIPRINITEEIM